jgi:Putative prokaryotic signal transducing protein
VVASEAEASMICGYLESQGIRAVYDKGNVPGFVNAWSGPFVGRQEILVAAADVETARALLATLPENQS